MKKTLADRLTDKFSFLSIRSSLDHVAFNVPQDNLLEVAKYIRDELKFDILSDIAGIDNGTSPPPRFTVVYHFFTTATHKYLRLATDCSDSEHPTCPSLVSLYPAADWHEREAYDMFGIEFKGHPDLKRILMWDSYEHYPLRKDFPLAGIESDLPAADVAEETNAKVLAAPMMGGPFCAKQESTMKFREPQGADQSWSEKHEKPTI